MEELTEDIKQYNELMEEFRSLDSSDYITAYRLSQTALSLADRWNEIMFDCIRYAKELNKTKSEVSAYCYEKCKILLKLHDFARMVYRQGSYALRGEE